MNIEVSSNSLGTVEIFLSGPRSKRLEMIGIQLAQLARSNLHCCIFAWLLTVIEIASSTKPNLIAA